jgi:signal transduction histidine kinase
VIIELISEMTPAALDKQIDLGLETTLNKTIIQGNADALSILLRNLIDNALHYIPIKSEITVNLTSSSKGICLQVLDNGPGIPEAQQDLMLQRFRRGQTNDHSGSGLGLSLVQRIVDLHQAQLKLYNRQQGGLCVEIYFSNTILTFPSIKV